MVEEVRQNPRFSNSDSRLLTPENAAGRIHRQIRLG